MLKFGRLRAAPIERRTHHENHCDYVLKRRRRENRNGCQSGNRPGRRRIKVLLIDLDPQGCATANFPMKQDYATFPTAYEWLLDKSTFAAAVRATNIRNLRLIGAEYRLSKIDDVMYTMDRRDAQFVLRDHLAQVEDRFDFCILDCMPSESMLKRNALTAADYALLPAHRRRLCIDRPCVSVTGTGGN